MRKERESKEDEHRILILGCGEAGKSTFIKQMQIIHSDGLGNEDKRKDKKPLIADNIMQAILTLINEMSFVQDNQLHDNDELADAVARHSDPNRKKSVQKIRFCLKIYIKGFHLFIEVHFCAKNSYFFHFHQIDKYIFWPFYLVNYKTINSH